MPLLKLQGAYRQAEVSLGMLKKGVSACPEPVLPNLIYLSSFQFGQRMDVMYIQRNVVLFTDRRIMSYKLQRDFTAIFILMGRTCYCTLRVLHPVLSLVALL